MSLAKYLASLSYGEDDANSLNREIFRNIDDSVCQNTEESQQLANKLVQRIASERGFTIDQATKIVQHACDDFINNASDTFDADGNDSEYGEDSMTKTPEQQIAMERQIAMEGNINTLDEMQQYFVDIIDQRVLSPFYFYSNWDFYGDESSWWKNPDGSDTEVYRLLKMMNRAGFITQESDVQSNDTESNIFYQKTHLMGYMRDTFENWRRLAKLKERGFEIAETKKYTNVNTDKIPKVRFPSKQQLDMAENKSYLVKKLKTKGDSFTFDDTFEGILGDLKGINSNMKILFIRNMVSVLLVDPDWYRPGTALFSAVVDVFTEPA